MYEAPAGVRGNMNPPQFQLLVYPLTALGLDAANMVFRGLNVVSLCVCLWWLSRQARAPADRWTVADLGALLSWAPMASMISLNELTWIVWPLLLVTWSCWRRERWTPGAVAFGVALGLKPFLGVLLLWLLVKGRWRPAAIAVGTALASFGIAWLAYGSRVFPAWVRALNSVGWWWAPMNASVQGWLARTVSPMGAVSGIGPPWLAPVATALAVLLLVVALIRTRHASFERSWRLLMLTALLASPLGWIYYLWWAIAGIRPVRVLFRAPILWLPFAYVSTQPSNRFVAATLASVYFWGVLLWWAQEYRLLAREAH